MSIKGYFNSVLQSLFIHKQWVGFNHLQISTYKKLFKMAKITDEEKEGQKPTRYNYGIIMSCDFPDENKKKEVMEVCQIACEKFAAAEKTPYERDNQAAASMIKETLDQKMDGPYNVVVGEAFSLDIDYVQTSLLHMLFGGFLGICVWKCV